MENMAIITRYQELRAMEISALEVQSFLICMCKPHAAKCWEADKIINCSKDLIDTKVIADWFKRYFPSNENQYLFELLLQHARIFYKN